MLNAASQLCRINFMRNVLAHASQSGPRVLASFIAIAFRRKTPSRQGAVAQGRRTIVSRTAEAGRLRGRRRRGAFMTFPAAHSAKLHSTNSIKGVNSEAKRRTD